MRRLPQALPSDLDVRLARVGSGDFAARTVRFAHWCTLLAWVLPLLGLALFGGVVTTSPNRRAARVRAGVAVLASGVLLGSVVFVLGLVASRLGEQPGLRPALAAAAWRELDTSLWWLAAGLVALREAVMSSRGRPVPDGGGRR